MSYVAAATGTYGAPASVLLARRFAAIVPAIVFAYSLLIWPILFAQPTLALPAELLSPEPESSPSLLTQLFFPCLASLTFLAFLAARPRFTDRAATLIFWISAFFSLALVSSMWSLDPAFTFSKAVYQIIVTVIFAMALATAVDFERVVAPIFWLMVVVVAINLVTVIMLPPGPIGHEGIYGHKNTFGANATAALMFGLYGLGRGGLATRLAAAATVAGAAVCLVASESKTAIGLSVVVPVVAVILLVLARGLRVAPLAGIVGGAVLVATLYIVAQEVLGFDNGDFFLFAFGDETFTGRTHIWEFTWGHIIDRPWLGHGFQGFWGIGPKSPKLAAEIPFIAKMPYAHNGFLDLWLETGIVGLALFLVVLAIALASAGRLVALGPGPGFLTLALFLFAIGRNTMESNWFMGTTVASLVFILVTFAGVFAPRNGGRGPGHRAIPSLGGRAR